MPSEPRSRIDGRTVEEWIAGHVHESLEEEIGLDLATIVFAARHAFGLDGDDLVAYLRRALTALVAAGATPEHCAPCAPSHVRGLVHHDADAPEEIAEGVLADWLAEGRPGPAWGDFRFNTAEDRAYLAAIAEQERQVSQRGTGDQERVAAVIAAEEARYAAAIERLAELGRLPAVEDTVSCLALAGVELGRSTEGAGIVRIEREAYDRLVADLCRGAREISLGPQYPGLYYLRHDGHGFGVRWDPHLGSKIDLFPPWPTSPKWVRRILPILADG